MLYNYLMPNIKFKDRGSGCSIELIFRIPGKGEIRSIDERTTFIFTLINSIGQDLAPIRKIITSNENIEMHLYDFIFGTTPVNQTILAPLQLNNNRLENLCSKIPEKVMWEYLGLKNENVNLVIFPRYDSGIPVMGVCFDSTTFFIFIHPSATEEEIHSCILHELFHCLHRKFIPKNKTAGEIMVEESLAMYFADCITNTSYFKKLSIISENDFNESYNSLKNQFNNENPAVYEELFAENKKIELSGVGFRVGYKLVSENLGNSPIWSEIIKKSNSGILKDIVLTKK
jgi:uncharacterized protein YjaZ